LQPGVDSEAYQRVFGGLTKLMGIEKPKAITIDTDVFIFQSMAQKVTEDTLGPEEMTIIFLDPGGRERKRPNSMRVEQPTKPGCPSEGFKKQN
jgi:hypothetical protein